MHQLAALFNPLPGFERGRDYVGLEGGFIFGHFFGGFEYFAPHLDNVTDDPGYSRLLADFSSVGGNVNLTVCFLEKRSFSLLGVFEGLRAPQKPKVPFFLRKQTYEK